MSLANLVGLIGAAALLTAYGLLQLGRLHVESHQFVLLNCVGILAILYSLITDFNYPTFVLYSTWLVFTIIGYARSRSKKLGRQS
jgi:hypothetical protein